MKKTMICILVVVLLCLSAIPAYAAENTSIKSEMALLEHYAYMDLAEADAEMQDTIIEARNEIINNTSWVADGIYGYVTDATGNVVEVLPQFSDVFPAEWEIPEYCVTIADNNSNDITPLEWGFTFNGGVRLTSTYTEFHTVSTGEFNGLVVQTISTIGYNTNGGTYNLQYYNKTTGKICGQKVGLNHGDAFNISAPKNATVSIRASTDGPRYDEWTMMVATDRVSIY